jgi:hypothetical protein
LASEDSTVAKLIDIRHRYVQNVELCRKKHREELLGEVVDVVLADPHVTEAPRETLSVVPPPAPAAPVPKRGLFGSKYNWLSLTFLGLSFKSSI